jgi:hypothetical protein
VTVTAVPEEISGENEQPVAEPAFSKSAASIPETLAVKTIEYV